MSKKSKTKKHALHAGGPEGAPIVPAAPPATPAPERAAGAEDGAGTHGWTFLTNHAHVLVCLATDPGLRVRDIAMRIGITERATVRILGDLVDAGYLVRRRVGRRNEYALRLDLPMRHPVEAEARVGALIEAVAAS
jgi:DNA-binding transcriptional ArsR family regulator